MNIMVWSNFSKRKNSTKQPTGGTSVTVTLKDQCSILSPVFILNTLDFTINYVEAFGHYYFADVTNLDGNRSEISCTIDHLASFKSNISAYTGLVEYTSASSNIMITDPRNRPTVEVANAHVSKAFDFSTSTTGCYIVGVAAKGGVKSGATTFYALSSAGFSDICDKIYDSGLWSQMWNQFNGVQNAILTCFWVPFDLTFVSTYFTGGAIVNFCIGDEVVAASDCYNIASRIHTGGLATPGSISVTFPFQFGGVQVPNYVYKAPYTTITLYLPFVGEIELPADIAADNPKFTIDYQMDILTGDIIYYLNGEEAGLIGTYTGNFASKVPVAGATYDAIGVVRGAITTAIGLGGTFVNPTAGIAGMFAGVGSAVNSLRLNSQSNGSISSALGGLFIDEAQIDVHTALPAEPALDSWKAEQGMPYFKTSTLSSLSGYIKCSNASVDIPGDGAEQDAVNSYLNSGFYLE